MKKAPTSSLRVLMWATLSVVSLHASDSPKPPPRGEPVMNREFYTPVYRPYVKSCPNDGCIQSLVTCKYKKEHRGKKCDYCPECDGKCTVCPEDFTRCAICLDNHPIHKEVVLVCNHTYGKKCLNRWLKTGNDTCPDCRAPVKKKKSSHCDFCDSKILPTERSCSYTCDYRVGWSTKRYQEKHKFHERCIQGFAEKNAFVLEEDGTIYFRCPLEHKKPVETLSDLYVEVLPIVPLIEERRDDIPIKNGDPSDEDTCEICHKEIKARHSECTYTCSWRRDWSVTKGHKVHHYHEKCLKPIAERRAKKNSLGEYVFFCPGDHEIGRDSSIAFQEDLEVPLLDGFTPQKEEPDLCAICDKEVDGDDDEVPPPLHYCGYPKGTFSFELLEEQLFFHSKCLNKYIIKHHKEVSTWTNGIEHRIPCPVHRKTEFAHDFVLHRKKLIEVVS